MLNIKGTDHVTNATIYSMTSSNPLVERVRNRQLKFLGHVLRTPDDELVKVYALYRKATHIIPDICTKSTWR